MRHSSYTGAFPLAAGSAGLVLFASFVYLGFWQLSRADQKRALYDSFTAGEHGPVLQASDHIVLPEHRYRGFEAHGEYLPERQFLLDAMTYQGRAGYEVLTPFRARDGAELLLINRGWVAAPADRAVLPGVAIESAAATIRGRIDALPVPGLRIGEPQPSASWPRVLLYPTEGEIEQALGAAVTPFQILLAPEAGDGYVRDWQPPAMPPETHMAYAVQWFALALALAGIGIVLVVRARRHAA